MQRIVTPVAPWQEEPLDNGTWRVHLASWAYFERFIREEMQEFRAYIWRGQASADWLLRTTLDRALDRYSKERREGLTRRHLQRFQQAARGRRGPNPPKISEDEWWALGQHHGLATPLLDWTVSPYVAAYFAFLPEGNGNCDRRAVWAVLRSSIRKASQYIKEDSDKVVICEPLSDENPRLVNQAGLFTRLPGNMDLENWVRSQVSNLSDTTYHLIKVTIPSSERDQALQSLNRMNINHLTLFPDLYGSSKFVNMDLEIPEY